MFFHGCNYPWSADGDLVYYGLDFGANIWGTHAGVSTRRPSIERDFRQMASVGFGIVRWFVFADGRSGIVFDERGLPAGLDSHVFSDMDSALEIARATGIRLCLVLLDHRWMYEGLPERLADPTTGLLFEAYLPDGRARVLNTQEGRDALLGRVVEPLIKRYGGGGARPDLGPHIFAIELMNEPDFVVEEWERDLSPRVKRPVRFEALAELVSHVSAIVHAEIPALTTMAAARLHNLWAWDVNELGLDFVQVHSYPDLREVNRDVDVFGMPANRLGMTKPIVLGEFPGNAPVQHPAGATPPPTTLGDYLEFALRSGYIGAWPWSFSGTDSYGRIPEEPLRDFARRHPDIMNPRARQDP